MVVESVATSYDGPDGTEPLAVLPVQLPDRNRRARRPEYLLALAVLDDALATVRRNVGARCGQPLRDLREACKWISDDSRAWGFSFLNLCDWLGLEASAIRRPLGPVLAGARRGPRGWPGAEASSPPWPPPGARGGVGASPGGPGAARGRVHVAWRDEGRPILR